MPKLSRAALFASVSALTLVAPVFAQDNSETLETVVVTGTLIRGTNPTGTNVVGMSDKDITATGANSTAQLLQNIPQLGTAFNALLFPPASGNSVTTNRPNLRQLPGFNTAGGATTLVLLNGHRIVGMGITSTTPDPDIIAPGAIQRVEVVPDGGSAIYGSDAVAGVMNFITKKKIDGIEADAHFGITDNYSAFSANLSGGTEWSTGSAYITYNFEQHTWVFGRDRDYVKLYPTSSADTALAANTTFGTPAGTFTSLMCSPGNIVTSDPIGLHLANNNYVYALGGSSLTPHTANECDTTKTATMYPKENRHSVMFGVSQQISSRVQLEVDGFYTNRVLRSVTGPFMTTANMGPSFLASFGYLQSPYTAAHATNAPFGNPAFATQTVNFQWGAADAQRQDTLLSTWGVFPTLTIDLGDNWELRVAGSYSESSNKVHNPGFAAGSNPLVLTNAINAGLFNPYDPATSNPAALAAIASWETFGYTRQRLADFSAIADGELFKLPAGGVKLAVGVEVLDDNFNTQNGTQIAGSENTGSAAIIVNGTTIYAAASKLPHLKARRTIGSGFAELNIPILSDSYALPLVEELTLSASARLDDYSDLGGTFNPKFGVTYRPIDWVKVRGAWGRSFNAPSLADTPKGALTTTSFLPSAYNSFFAPAAILTGLGYPAITSSQAIMSITGNSSGIHNQTARTLSLGADVTPPFISGLNLSLTYWRIQMTGQIGVPPYYSPGQFWSLYSNLVTFAPTQAQINAAIAASDSAVTGGCSPQPTCVYAILDARKTNLGNLKVGGLDFNVVYDLDTSFGSIEAGTAGTVELQRDNSAGTGPFTDTLGINSGTFFRGRTWVAATVGDFDARLSWNHTQGFKLDPAVGIPSQSKIDAFDTFDLFAGYNFHGNDLVTRDLSITLNVYNLFAQNPPVYRQPPFNGTGALNSGYNNGNTLGRLFQFGISKKF